MCAPQCYLVLPPFLTSSAVFFALIIRYEMINFVIVEAKNITRVILLYNSMMVECILKCSLSFILSGSCLNCLSTAKSNPFSKTASDDLNSLYLTKIKKFIMSQQYCLRWNNHQHNLLSVFEDLLHHEAFVDVTLACDGLQLKAHKMVLSACSPYFQSMLYGTPDRHPIVFLRDVRYHEMKALLEFMYRGEVSVDQDNLTSLLKVAEGLKIKGLADVNEQKQQQQAQAAMAGLLTLQQSPAHPLFPGMMSPSNNSKRPASPNPPPNPNSSSQQQNPNYLGPKRKRGRPRRLSGSEAVPLASGLVDNTTNDELHVQTEDMNTKVKEEKVNIIFPCFVDK